MHSWHRWTSLYNSRFANLIEFSSQTSFSEGLTECQNKSSAYLEYFELLFSEKLVLITSYYIEKFEE